MKRYYSGVIATLIGLLIVSVWAVTLTIIVLDILYTYASV